MGFYEYSAVSIEGNKVEMQSFEGKVVLVVNTASKCGFTPQYKGLEALYKKYGPENFVVLGFPCDQFGHQEPGEASDIIGFCELNFGVTFPLFDKIDVKGDQAHPIFVYLKSQQKGLFGDEIKWNFTKFLLDRKGRVVGRYAPATEPEKLESDIEGLL